MMKYRFVITFTRYFDIFQVFDINWKKWSCFSIRLNNETNYIQTSRIKNMEKKNCNGKNLHISYIIKKNIWNAWYRSNFPNATNDSNNSIQRMSQRIKMQRATAMKFLQQKTCSFNYFFLGCCNSFGTSLYLFISFIS